MTTAPPLPHVLRFDQESHTYSIDGTPVPSITQLLERCGYISEAFYTDRSAERGHAVHQLCADFDHGAITKADLRTCTSAYKPWLLTYVTACDILRPTWLHIEEAFISVRYRFGGRPDRLGLIHGAQTIVDIKSGAVERWHSIQTALQDILLADAGDEPRLPIGVRQRFSLYIRPTKTGGRWKFRFLPHQDKRDYDKAREVLRVGTRG